MLIPCCGQLEYTKLCVVSVLRHTRKPFELVFLDIGSLDGTREFLAGVALAAAVRVESVRTATDEGIGAAVDEAVNPHPHVRARGGGGQGVRHRRLRAKAQRPQRRGE